MADSIKKILQDLENKDSKKIKEGLDMLRTYVQEGKPIKSAVPLLQKKLSDRDTDVVYTSAYILTYYSLKNGNDVELEGKREYSRELGMMKAAEACAEREKIDISPIIKKILENLESPDDELSSSAQETLEIAAPHLREEGIREILALFNKKDAYGSSIPTAKHILEKNVQTKENAKLVLRIIQTLQLSEHKDLKEIIAKCIITNK